MHVNDIKDCIPRGIPVSISKFADDFSFKDSVSQMQVAVAHLERWAVHNKKRLTAKRPQICGSPSRSPARNIGPTELERVSEFKLLGVYVQNDLRWNTHVSSIVSKACKASTI